MKKLMVVVAFAVVIPTVVDATAVSTNVAASRARKRERFIRNTGGYVYKREPNAGQFTFVNAQRRVSADGFAEVQSELMRFFSIDVVFREGTFDGKGDKGFVYIIDDPSRPGLVVVPEEGWATVNVAKYGDKNLAERVNKELWRAFSFVCGAADTGTAHCLLRPIFKPEDLDSDDAKTISPVPLMNMDAHIKAMGIKKFLRTTYKQACISGWAPAPTNDIQKAIWDKVHAMPTEPIKIKPETKKVDR